MCKLFSLFFFIILTSLFACFDSNARSSEKDNTTSNDSDVVFKIALGGGIRGLDPLQAKGFLEFSALCGVFEGLVFVDPLHSNPTLGVAASQPIISADGLVYTFSLRNNLTWSDGKSLTAHDFVYGHKRILNPKLGSKSAVLLYPISGAKEYNEGTSNEDSVKIVALDDLTIEYTLKSPTPYFLQSMTHYAFYPHPKHAIKKYGKDWTKKGHFVGNGPFTLKQWVTDSYLEMERNPHYYDSDSIKLDRIIFYSTSDSTKAYNMFKRGEIDWISGVFPNDIIKEVYKRPDLHVSMMFANKFLIYNLAIDHFKDIRVREALALALDKEELTNNVLNNSGLVTGSFVPSIKGSRYESIIRPKSETFNPEKAKDLLAQAGFPGGKGFPSVILTYKIIDYNIVLCQWVQEQWAKHLGINVIIQGLERKVLQDNLNRQEFFIASGGWYGDYKDPVTFLSLFLKSNVNRNTGKYHNPEFEVLMEKASNMHDEKERFKVLRAAEEIILQDYPIIPLYFPDQVHLIDTKKWGGWFPNLLNRHSLKSIYLKKQG